MVQQNKGKIFLAEERGHQEVDRFRSLNTFNFGQYQQEHKTPFVGLYVLNDDTLAGGNSISMNIATDSYVLLMPIVGAVDYKDSNGISAHVAAGECLCCAAPKDTAIHITNPYENELVNFLQLWFYRTGNEIDTPEIIPFDIDNNRNQFIPLSITVAPFKASIGKFAGREEAVYTLTNNQNGLFVFVIQGAFEVQYRLLHARDGLALWEVDAVEVEALSSGAILLVIEMPLSS